ncbi:MAG TPA: alginate export family protein [Phycisphaerae bacterium]|nr:alginate export family protein [Phycisphaerae bacterium]
MRPSLFVLPAVAFLALAWTAATGAEPPADEPTRDWLDQLKNPAPWLEWGGDLRLRYEYSPNAYQLNHRLDTEQSYVRYRPRVWAKVTPAPTVEVNARLTWEFRTWYHPNHREVFDEREAAFDTLNVHLKDLGDLPLSLTLGRQELHYGDAWLIQEGTPSDGSATFSFNAAKLTWELQESKTVVDAIYIQNYSDTSKYIRPFDDDDGRRYDDNNSTGAILYVTNKSLEKTQIEGYLIVKNDRRTAARGNDATIYTYGGRATGDITNHWAYAAQGAVQTGHRNAVRHEAYGVDGRVTRHFRDALKNACHAGYEFLSGDNPNSGPYTGWDVVWARDSRFSRLFERLLGLEEGTSRWTNMHRVNVGWQCEPVKRTKLACNYHLLMAPANPFAGAAGLSADGHVRGHLVTAKVDYTVNKHLSMYVLFEEFWPGDYYTQLRDEPASFLRFETVVKW